MTLGYALYDLENPQGAEAENKMETPWLSYNVVNIHEMDKLFESDIEDYQELVYQV